MNKQEIKQKIEDHETYGMGLHKIGGHARIVNLRVTNALATCDLIIGNDYEQTSERYNGVEYDVQKLMSI